MDKIARTMHFKISSVALIALIVVLPVGAHQKVKSPIRGIENPAALGSVFSSADRGEYKTSTRAGAHYAFR
jgi:hypothetical protein